SHRGLPAPGQPARQRVPRTARLATSGSSRAPRTTEDAHVTYPPNESQPEWGTPQEPSGQRRVDPSARGDGRALAVVAHLSPVIAAIVSAGWLSFVGPLVIWFIYKDRNALVRNAAASPSNFHITIWIAWI